MENKYYIYLHINLITGLPFYVGKGTGRRAFSKSGRNSYWRRIVDKYDYDVILLEEYKTQDEALELEKYWISRIGREKLTNMTDGGDGQLGNKFSESTKNKISIGLMNNRNGLYRGNDYRNSTVLQYDKDNNFIKEFKTIKESQLETSSPHISKVCTGKRKTSGGFIWRYKNKEAKCTFN